LDSNEKVVVPLLVMQTICVVFLWTLDTLGHVSQTIFTIFLSADLLSFALMAHFYRLRKSGRPMHLINITIWMVLIIFLFAAGFVVS
jgi:surface polysaccharide O-acyltransferase-like enzyme